MANAEDILNVARRELGYSRWDDPLPGTKYGRWYAVDHGEYYGHSGVAFCAMFVSWVLNQAAVTMVHITPPLRVIRLTVVSRGGIGRLETLCVVDDQITPEEVLIFQTMGLCL